jgi:hypothetical protein
MGKRERRKMSAVVDPPINLTDRSISRAGSAASQASYETLPVAPLETWTTMWTGQQFRRRRARPSEGLVLHVPQDILNAPWFRPTVHSVFRALSLRRGWDTYDALPISYQSAEDALTFLSQIIDPAASPPAVVPLADGGVQLEWHRGGLDVEFAFSPDEQPELYVADRETGTEWDLNPFSPEFDEIRPLLVRLAA